MYVLVTCAQTHISLCFIDVGIYAQTSFVYVLFSLKHLNFIYNAFSDNQVMNAKISHGMECPLWQTLKLEVLILPSSLFY